MKKKINETWKKVTSMALASVLVMTSGGIVNAEENGGTAGEWDSLKAKLSAYNAEWENADFNAVTGCMPDSALLGNGDMGAVSSGSETQKTYLLTKGDFWNCGNMNTNNLHGADPNRISPVSLGGITIESASEGRQGLEAAVEACGYIPDSDPYYTYDPDGIIDNKMTQDNEEWACNINHGTAGEHWFIIDLQEEISLKKYELYHQAAMKPGEANMNTDSYQVLVSTDKTEWTEIESVTGNTDNVTVNELEEAIPARYIKVNITKPNPNRDNTARIVEMKIFDDEGYNVLTGEKQGEFYETQDITTGELSTEMTMQEPVSLRAWVARMKIYL